MKQIILTESQFDMLFESQVIAEALFNGISLQKIKKYIENLFLTGASIATIYSMVNDFCTVNNVPEETKEAVLSAIEDMPSNEINVRQKANPVLKDWKLADNKTLATVYNAKPSQCNSDFGKTASMFRLNLDNVSSQRIIAMERTFMQKLGLKYGDVVYIEGTGKYDGVWQIQDTMNKRFAGEHKIDILVPDNVRAGQWDNVNVYVLKDKGMTETYRSKMAPPASKELNEKQVAAKRAELERQKKLKQQQKQNKIKKQ